MELSSLRMRPSRTREEQSLFKRKSDEVFKLNTAAKNENKKESFSLRENGQIWRFTQNENGRWVRDKDWQEGN